MNERMKKAFAPAVLLVLMLALGACATSGTRSATTDYNELCEMRQEPYEVGPTGAGTNASTTLQGLVTYSWTAPDSLTETTAEISDISTVRRYVANLRHDYERAECHAEKINRHFYDHPLLATAIAITGATLARANTYVIGGLGLIAGGTVALKTYNHPDTDRDAFLTAYSQLTCVYDQTHDLPYMPPLDNLRTTRSALDASLVQVGVEIANFDAATVTRTDKSKALVAAAKSAQDAGEKAVAQLTQTISDHDKTSTTIMIVAHQIDDVARQVDKTSGSYATFAQTVTGAYKTIGQNEAKSDTAKDSLKDATVKQSAAAAISSDSDPNQTKGQKESWSKLLKASPALTVATVYQRNTGGTAIAAAVVPQAKAIVDRDDIGAIKKLLALTTYAGELSASPTYAEVTVKVIECGPKPL